MITIKRVSYGKKNTPKELREYKIVKLGRYSFTEQTSPVGTMEEFTELFPKNKLKVIA